MVRLAMGWVLKKQGITSVLVGASQLCHLENAIDALEMDFPDEWVHEMDGGDRVPSDLNRSTPFLGEARCRQSQN
jgi:aryl-alcohol dehydrogenase-like predicted oxidoreductase